MGKYGENPNPNSERMQIGLANKLYTQREIDYWNKRNEQKHIERPKKRTLPSIIYQEFYKEVNKTRLNLNFSEDWREKAGLLMRHFSGTKIAKNLNNFIREKDYVKIGALFNNLVDYSQKRIQQ